MNRALKREQRGQRKAFFKSMRCNVIGNGKASIAPVWGSGAARMAEAFAAPALWGHRPHGVHTVRVKTNPVTGSYCVIA
jgi:hypothetical protein